MTDAPKDPDKLPESDADARFKRLVGNLVNTPHKPHKPAGVPHERSDPKGERA